MAHSPDHSLAPASGAPSAALSGIPSAAPVPAALRPMSAVPVAELPPLRPLPTNDPYSPVATGQALFCAVFNVTFSTLLAWLASVPQHLIAQVRQTFSSPSPSPAPSPLASPAPHSVALSPGLPVAKSSSAPLSFSERILLACRSLFSLLRVYHTFSSYWDRVTPRQLGLLSRAAQAIKSFSGRSFDFSYWADLAGPRPRSYSFASSVTPSSSVAPSPDLPLAPSSSPSPRSALRTSPTPPFPEWPFTALTAYNASFTMAPGRLLAQVCQDLARLTQSPSPDPSEFESPSPSQSAVALSSQSQSQSCSHSQSQSNPSIGSMGSIGSIPPISKSPSPQVSLSSSVPQSPSPQVPLSSSVPPSPCPQIALSSHPSHSPP